MRGKTMGIVVAALGVLAGPAAAADRHAAVDGSATADCATPATACDLRRAVQDAASGDVVHVGPGTYGLAGNLTVPGGVTVDGGTPRPVLQQPGLFRVFAPGVTVRDLELRGIAGSSAPLVLSSCDGLLVERVRVTHDGSFPMRMTCSSNGTALVRDSELVSNARGPLVQAWFNARATVRWRNVLVEAPAATVFEAQGFEAGERPVLQMDIRSSILDTELQSAPTFGGSVVASVGSSLLGRPLPTSIGDLGANVRGRPVYVDRAAGDLHQAPSSPARNAGTVDDLTSPTDIDGDPRPTGSAPDMGPDEQPLLPPVATASAAQDVTRTGLQLTGEVDPRALATTARFEWGTTPALGQVTPAQDAGDGDGPVALRAPIGDLEPGTTIHFRLVAENAEGAAQSAVRTATTQAAPPPADARPAPDAPPAPPAPPAPAQGSSTVALPALGLVTFGIERHRGRLRGTSCRSRMAATLRVQPTAAATLRLTAVARDRTLADRQLAVPAGRSLVVLCLRAEAAQLARDRRGRLRPLPARLTLVATRSGLRPVTTTADIRFTVRRPARRTTGR